MKIKVNNLRNLNFSDPFELKSINLIVGKNSSGKSSFLRMFPLLRQSLEVKTSSPILWYGPYVDFGTYEESVCKYRNEEPIRLGIEIDVPEEMLPNYNVKQNRKESIQKESMVPMKLYYAIKNDLIKSFQFSVNNYKVTLNFSKEEKVNIEVDGTVIDFIKGIEVIKEVNTIQFMPYDLGKKEWTTLNMNLLSPFRNTIRELGAMELRKIILDMAYSSTSDQKINNTVNEIMNIDIECFFEGLQIIARKSSVPKAIAKKISSLKKEDDLFTEIRNIVIVSRISDYIRVSNALIASIFSDVEYIAPVRANAERYYRHQGLSVDMIDSKGENIPHFLNNMKADEKKDLNKWLSKQFSFEIYNKATISHNSLFIKDLRTNVESNMTDCGFGFSQIIPILLQLWLAKSNKRKYNKNILLRNYYNLKKIVTKIIVIEQPELHLHPALQARLIDTMCLIVKEFKEMGKSINFILETHSETLVNRIYRNMLVGLIEKNEFNISIFDTNENGEAKVSFAEFDENQNIVNWPVGFFLPEI